MQRYPPVHTPLHSTSAHSMHHKQFSIKNNTCHHHTPLLTHSLVCMQAVAALGGVRLSVLPGPRLRRHRRPRAAALALGGGARIVLSVRVMTTCRAHPLAHAAHHATFLHSLAARTCSASAKTDTHTQTPQDQFGSIAECESNEQSRCQHQEKCREALSVDGVCAPEWSRPEHCRVGGLSGFARHSLRPFVQ